MNQIVWNVMLLSLMKCLWLTRFFLKRFLRAMKPSCKLILVGDSDQLPSVGAGNILRDLIDSDCVTIVTLREIFRQAAQSLIVTNAH